MRLFKPFVNVLRETNRAGGARPKLSIEAIMALPNDYILEVNAWAPIQGSPNEYVVPFEIKKINSSAGSNEVSTSIPTHPMNPSYLALASTFSIDPNHLNIVAKIHLEFVVSDTTYAAISPQLDQSLKDSINNAKGIIDPTITQFQNATNNPLTLANAVNLTLQTKTSIKNELDNGIISKTPSFGNEFAKFDPILEELFNDLGIPPGPARNRRVNVGVARGANIIRWIDILNRAGVPQIDFTPIEYNISPGLLLTDGAGSIIVKRP